MMITRASYTGSTSYFQRVARETPTRVWVNNPTAQETRLAIAAGAISATTNPSYCSKLLQRDPQLVEPFVTEAAGDLDDLDAAADLVYQRVSGILMDAFRPLHDAGPGSQGFVTLQDNPKKDDDPDSIVEAALRHRELGPNYMAKIPVTEPGLKAMEYLVGQDIPLCATECFSLSQAIAACEVHSLASKKTGRSPPFFLTHITGIFDEEIASQIAEKGVEIAPELVAQAGCIVARRIYKAVRGRGYRVTLLGGGARSTRHFTEFVGGDFHVTLNWDAMKELIDADAPAIERIDAEASKDEIDELLRKLPTFAHAFNEGGLAPDQFIGFSPLQRFRNSFLKGWGDLCRAIEWRKRIAGG